MIRDFKNHFYGSLHRAGRDFENLLVSAHLRRAQEPKKNPLNLRSSQPAALYWFHIP